MTRQIVITSIVAAVAAALVCTLVLRADGPAAQPRPAAEGDDTAATIAALREEVAALRKQLTATQATAAQPSAAATEVVAEAPYDDEEAEQPVAAPPAARPSRDGEDRTAAYEAAVAQAERRFAMLGRNLQQQGRNGAWAAAREQEIAGLTTQNEYFKNTRFDTLDCRSDTCRVVATFPNEADRDNFAETFPGYVPQLPYAALRPIPNTNPPQSEVFLSTAGPLAR